MVKQTEGAWRGLCRSQGTLFTYQFLLLHALHEDDEQMLSLGSSVCESLLDGHQQLVPQRFIYKSVIKSNVQIGQPSSYSVHATEKYYRTQESIMMIYFRQQLLLPVFFSQQSFWLGQLKKKQYIEKSSLISQNLKE